MRSDLEDLMQEASLDALLVRGPAAHNPAMAYFTGLRHVTRGYLIKVRGKDPILFHDPMEREEAAATGLRTRSLTDLDERKLLEQAQGDLNLAEAMLLKRIFEELGLRGRVAIYGKVEVGPAWTSFRNLEQMLPEVEIVGEGRLDSVIARARLTKDVQEIERIRTVGKAVTAVVADVASFLTSHQVRNGHLVNREGEPLTVREVKRKINLWLAMRGADNPKGCIFAVGREAGIPHSAGTDDNPIPVGQTIIFDIYPCEAGGGYYFDFTRTWCLGHAPDEVQAAYEDVIAVYEKLFTALRPGGFCRDYQIQACELFESRGHPTQLNSPKTTDGYVHSLAHGIGLEVHEAPSFSLQAANKDRLQEGSVITLEPGLYYPERGFGVRIEDTVWIRPDGQPEILAEFPKDLVLRMPAA